MEEANKSETEQVVVKVDVKLKKLWAEEMEQIKAADTKGAEAWCSKYEHIATITEHVPPLYLAGGYSTEAEFFQHELEETRQSVYRNMRVAKLATSDEVAKYTATRLNLAIAYVEARAKAPIKNRSAIDFGALRIQFKRDKKTVTKTLETISKVELVEAVAQVTGHEAKPSKASPAEKIVTAAVKRSGVDGIKATVTKSLLVLRVPLDGVAAIARELADFKVPTG